VGGGSQPLASALPKSFPRLRSGFLSGPPSEFASQAWLKSNWERREFGTNSERARILGKERGTDLRSLAVLRRDDQGEQGGSLRGSDQKGGYWGTWEGNFSITGRGRQAGMTRINACKRKSMERYLINRGVTHRKSKKFN